MFVSVCEGIYSLQQTNEETEAEPQRACRIYMHQQTWYRVEVRWKGAAGPKSSLLASPWFYKKTGDFFFLRKKVQTHKATSQTYFCCISKGLTVQNAQTDSL